MNSIKDGLINITWDDLQKWVGSKILNRGRSYRKNVYELSRTEEGGLVAWVSGSEEYATWVDIDTEGELDWFCTCPYNWGGMCKHGVAVLLRALEKIKAEKNIPLVEPTGELLSSLLDERDYIQDEDNLEESSALDKATEAALQKILKKKKKVELLELLIELATEYPQVRRSIMEEEQLQKGDTKHLVQSLITEIEELATEPAYSSWDDEGHLPDYSHVQKQLAALLRGGHANAVLEVGRVLWDLGHGHVEESHDDGDLAEEIIEAMDIVFEAVPESSLSRPEQLLWVIEILLEDQYGLGGTGEEVLYNTVYSKEDWLLVAEELGQRLAGLIKPEQKDFSSTYGRKRLMDRVIEAYEQSGQQELILSLLESEAPVTWCYDRLVDTLMAQGKIEKARQWCVKGFSMTKQEAPGIANSLQTKLRDLAAREKNFHMVAAYHAQDFFEHPSRSSYITLQKATNKVDCWAVVRTQILDYLVNGRRPDLSSRSKPKNKQGWPLPLPEVNLPRDRRFLRDFPDINMLIEIAILECRLDDVVALYQKQLTTNRWKPGIGGEVAKAVSKSHPEVSLGIWVKMAEEQICLVKPKAYEVAASYLRKMHEVFKETGQLSQWQRLVKDIRLRHKAKRRLLEVLDGLEGNRIID